MAKKDKEYKEIVLHKTIKIPNSLFVKIAKKAVKNRWSFHKTVLITLEEAL